MDQIKTVLTKKLAGIPVWIIGALAVLGLAFYLKRKQAASQAAQAAQNTASTAGPESTFPYANPMNYSSDVFVNVSQPPDIINNIVPGPSNQPVSGPPVPYPPPPSPSPTPVPLPSPPPKQKSITYVVQRGDTLWGIAQRYLGAGNKYGVLYQANKASIESIARSHGYSSSQGGHWIFPGEKIVIPQ